MEVAAYESAIGGTEVWNHKIINVLDRLPKRQHESAKLMLRNIPYAESRSEAQRLRYVFGRWCREHSYERAVALRTAATGFCNGNAAGAGGRSTVLITGPGFLLIETKTLAHVSGKRHAGDFRG